MLNDVGGFACVLPLSIVMEHLGFRSWDLLNTKYKVIYLLNDNKRALPRSAKLGG